MKRKRRYTIGEKVVLCLLKFGFMFGILMVAGGVGSIDFADETGVILTTAEQIRYYFISIMGIPVAGICMWILGKIDE